MRSNSEFKLFNKVIQDYPTLDSIEEQPGWGDPKLLHAASKLLKVWYEKSIIRLGA